jgi:Ca2+/H+ antiporter
MNDYEKILVAALSTALAIFLILGIIATIKVIQILNKIKSVSEKAEHIASKAEEVSNSIGHSVGLGFLQQLFAVFSDPSSKRRKR